MKRIYTLLIILAILSFTNLYSQTEKVKGKLISDTADLTILNIYPDSFPNVSVVFKAETRAGEPVWNLTKGKMKVLENTQNCEVEHLEPISKNKPIYIGIVIDHSASMAEDVSQLYDKFGMPRFYYDNNNNVVFPKGYIAPIDNAKSAVKDFVSSFNTEKDFISIIGFGSTIDKKLPLTHDKNKINALMNSVQAESGTALYDGMLAGLNLVGKADGIKVLVVLTDGQDNASKAKWKTVVKKANKEDIPIYIIGLGNVDAHILKKMAAMTKGQFYSTHSSKSLMHIYQKISKQVQAFYNLVYRSPNFEKTDVDREVELSFDIDSIALVTNAATVHLPSKVIANMQAPAVKKEIPEEVKSFISQKDNRKEYSIYGAIAVALLAGGGTIVYKYKKTKIIPGNTADENMINNLYPNPTTGIINLEFNKAAGQQLQIMNMRGQLVKTIDLNGVDTQFDLSDLSGGLYSASIAGNGQEAGNVMKFVLDR